MNFYNNLESFLFAYEFRSFSKAAHKLNITQAAVSNHIKKLESYLGERLFERDSKGILPTKSAQKLYTLISEPLDKIRGVMEDFSKYTNSMSGEIYISCINEFSQNLIMNSIGVCLEHGIKLRINYITRDFEIFKELENDTIDFGITSLKCENPNIKFLKIFDDEIILTGTQRWDKYLNQATDATFKENLKSLRWLAYGDAMPFIKRYFEFGLDISPNIIEPYLTFTDLNGLVQSVVNGYGVACLPKSCLLPI